jgi:phosphoglycerate dehydrogenase-like enzyme
MFDDAAWEVLDRFAAVIHHPGGEAADKDGLLALLPQADAVITSWGTAPLDEDVIAAAPRLRAMAHMGGSVKRFVSPALWTRGIQVTSAAPALARDVAETAVGLMLVGAKRIWPLSAHLRDGGWRESAAWPSRELHASVVGLVGAGHVGRHVIRLLKPFDADILLADPFVTAEDARELGVELTDLDELVRRADIVSLHAAANPQTYHLLDGSRLAMLKNDAVLINTARGTLIDEAALIVELQKGRLFAFLDVMDPEPPMLDNPLRSLPNVVLTPHLAGCIDDCSRMGAMAVEELRRFFGAEPPINPVAPDMFDRIS